MKALIVYDSVFGNTEKVARAMGEAIGTSKTAVSKAGDVKPEQLKGLNLLIVGSPTRAFRPTQAVKNFLRGLPQKSLQGMKVASFDTRMNMSDIEIPILRFMSNIFGYAAKPIAAGLTKKGGNLIVSPEGFIVSGSEGPLKKGELERVKNWTKKVMGLI